MFLNSIINPDIKGMNRLSSSFHFLNSNLSSSIVMALDIIAGAGFTKKLADIDAVIIAVIVLDHFFVGIFLCDPSKPAIPSPHANIIIDARAISFG